MSIFASQYLVGPGVFVDVTDTAAFRTHLGLGSAAQQSSTAFALASHTHAPTSIAGATTNAQLIISRNDGTFTAARLVNGGGMTFAPGDGTLSLSAGTGYIEQPVPLNAMVSTDRPPLFDWPTTGVTLPRARFTDGTEGTSTERLGFDWLIPAVAATTGNATITGTLAALSASSGTIMLSVGSGTVGGSTYAMTRATPVNASSTVGGTVAATIELPMSSVGSPGARRQGVVEITNPLPGDLRGWHASAQTTGNTITNNGPAGTAAQMAVMAGTTAGTAVWTASTAPTLPWNTGSYVLSLNGTNAYFMRDLVAADTSAAMTFSGWVNIRSTTAFAAVCQFLPRNGHTVSTTNEFLMDLGPSGNSPRLIVGGATSGTSTALIATTSSTISLNTWAHVAGRTDGTNGALFLNGVRVASGTHSPIIWAGQGTGFPVTAKIYYGASQYAHSNDFASGQYLPGLSSDFRHYKRALSDGEIAQLAASKHEDGSTAYTGGTVLGDVAILSPGLTIRYPAA